jgi:hypothetical protein
MDPELKQFSVEEHVQEALATAFGAAATEQLLVQLAAEHELTDERAALLAQTVRAVFTGQLEDSDISVALVDEGGIDFDVAVEIQESLYDGLLVELQDYLDEQRQLYVDLHPEEFVEPEPPPRDIDVELAQEAVIDSGLAPVNDRLQHRLLDIAVARIKDVRDDAETLHMLTKPTKTGGLAMEPERAEQILTVIKSAALSREQKAKEVEAERAAWHAEHDKAQQAHQVRLSALAGSTQPAPSQAPVVTESDDLLLADEAEDNAEIAVIKEEMVHDKDVPADSESAVASNQPAAGSADFLAQQVYQAVADSGFKTKDEDLQRRFRTVVEMLFRDLRDTLETRQKLELAVESGGLGLKPDKAEALMAGLEGKLNVYRSVMATQVDKEKKSFVAERQQKLLQADEKQAAAEQQARDQMFERVTGKAAGSLPTVDEAAAQAVTASKAAAAPATLPTPKPVPAAEPKLITVKAVPKTGAEAVPAEAPAKSETGPVKHHLGEAVSPPAAQPPAAPKPVSPPAAQPPAAPQPETPRPPAKEGKSVPVNLPTIDEIEEPVMLAGPADEDKPAAQPTVKPAAKPVAKPAAPKAAAPKSPTSELDGLFGDDGPVAAANTKAGSGAAAKKTPWELEMLDKMKSAKPAAPPPAKPAPDKSAPAKPAPDKPAPEKSEPAAAPTAKPAASTPPPPPPPPPPPKPAASKPVAPSKPTAPQSATPPTLPKPEPIKPPVPAPVATPAQAAAPTPTPDKKMVSDVKFTPKLTGPVEELKSMRLKDFRHLSKDPAEATLKISDKIDLLQEQQFEMKTAGIKAWQDSPVNRLYLEMLRQSLEGKPVAEVIKERTDMKDPVLSKAEFDAIMALNRKLRFG